MSTLFVALTAIAALGAPIPNAEVVKQNETFKQLWETDFTWQYDKLPEAGGVAEWRVPYSGYIYPDTAGGTRNALSKYDRAFNGGRGLATAYEARDTSMTERQPGLFGGRLSRADARLVRSLQRLDFSRNSPRRAGQKRNAKWCHVLAFGHQGAVG